jgi:hypothetical protein
MAEKKTLRDQVETQIIETESLEPAKKTRTRRKSYVMDLRVHSPASLGYLGIGGIDTAPALVRLAKVKGLDVIAVTDFFSGDFLDRIIDAAKDSSLTVIPGVMIRCKLRECDDVVISCMFPEEYGQEEVERFLLDLGINRRSFGDRAYLVEKDFDDILDVLEQHNGVALPSRMDKTPHRKAILPVLVEEYGFRTFDLAYKDSEGYFKDTWPKIKFNLYSFSNANALAQVGSRTAKVKMFEPGFTGIREMTARDM